MYCKIIEVLNPYEAIVAALKDGAVDRRKG